MPVLAFITMVCMVTGCGSAEPTATAIQATATQIGVEATSFPLPPTATLAPATATGAPIPPTESATLPPTRTSTSTSTPLPTSTPTPLSPLTGSGGGVIAFTSARDGNLEIYVMNADGSDPRRMTNQPGEDYWPTWSPDGTQIAFASERDGNFEIYVLAVPQGMVGSAQESPGNLRRLTQSSGDELEPDWSPDGTQIAFMYYSAGRSTIQVMDADGGNRHQLTDNPGGDSLPAWSPDGTQIAFVSERDGNPEIYVMDSDGSNQRRLTDNPGQDSYPAWSTAGTSGGAQISFFSSREGSRELYLMASDGTSVRQLTHDNASVWVSAWSPDGSQIAFTSARDGNREIYVMAVPQGKDASGAEPGSADLRRLTDNHILDGIPAWRPALPAAPGYVPLFEAAGCQFEQPSGYQLDCGYLTVPEDRTQPDGRMVRLHVAIVRSSRANPEPDPVIYLTGGGGVDTFDYLPWFLPAFGDAILRDRDLIFFNQRGMHHNDPQLRCPGLPELLQHLAAPGPNGEYIDRQEREAQQAAFFADCHADLVAQGIKLEMYDSATSAADADDLRAALGYDQVNYYGSSYGTLLGLLIMRDHPQGARSVVLDSVFPPEADYYIEFGRNAYDTFRTLFDGCAADAQCSQQYPNLEEKFLQVVDQLNANPRTTTWQGNQAVMYDGGSFVDVIYLFPYLGEPEMAMEAIEDASRGNFTLADRWAPETMDLDSYQIRWGFYRNRECREEVPFYAYDDYYALMEGLPSQIVAHYKPSLVTELCAMWPVEPAAAIEDEPVVSDVPALVLSGEIDPITPPRWARRAASHLSNSYYYMFPGYGHGVTRKSECALAMMLQFLDDPSQEPDASCVGEPRR